MKAFQHNRILLFRNNHDVGPIDALQVCPTIEEVMTKLQNIRLNSVPMLLEESLRETVRAWGFVCAQSEGLLFLISSIKNEISRVLRLISSLFIKQIRPINKKVKVPSSSKMPSEK